MKFIKISKFAKLAIISSLLTGGILATTIPMIIQTTSVQNTTSSTNNDKRISTGKITHGTNTQVVSSVNDIIIDQISNTSLSRNAIVSKNGVQELYVWGANGSGQLGIGDFTSVSYPIKFDLTQFGTYDSIDFKYIDGSGSSYAIVTEKSAQRLYMWGQNSSGQLGLGTTTNVSTPTLLSPSMLGNYDSIDSIYFQSNTNFIITIKNNQKQLYGSGFNNTGQIGDGTSLSKSIFQLIPSSSLGNYTDIIKFSCAQGSTFIIVNTPSGQQLYVWGANGSGQLGINNNTSILSPMLHINTALFNSSRLPSLEIYFSLTSYAWDKTLNQLYTWGRNDFGQLGLNSTTNVNTPTLIQASVLGNGTIMGVNFGENSEESFAFSISALMQINGQLSIYVWGLNGSGQLGLGNTTNRLVPTQLNMAQIGNPANIRDFSLAYNGGSSYALVEINNNLRYYVWGSNTNGQLGIGNTTNQSTPQQMSIPANTTLVNAWLKSSMSSMVINNNGVLENYVCGLNSSGQLGLGDTIDKNRMTQALQVNQSTEFLLNSNATYDISATDAFNQMYSPGGNINKKLLSKYMNITKAPERMQLNLVGSPNIDFANGILNITIAPTIIIPPLSITPVTYNRPMSFAIPGFRKVTAVKNVPVAAYKTVPNNLNADQLFDTVTNADGIVTNFSLLSQYIDLTSIPQDAVIKLVRIPNADKNRLDFTFFSNKYYNESGASVVNRDPITGLVIDYKTNINIKIDMLDLGLIIGLSVGGGVLLFILVIVLIKVISKYKAVKSYGEYLE